MGRLIDACKVIEKINGAIELLGIASKTAAGNEGFQTTIKAYRDVRDAIMREPTAEPERKTGRWVWNENGMDWGLGAWCCSECGIKAETWWANNKKYNPLKCSGGNFCGICGADMRGEK